MGGPNGVEYDQPPRPRTPCRRSLAAARKELGHLNFEPVPVISKAQNSSHLPSATPDPATALICCCSRLRAELIYQNGNMDGDPMIDDEVGAHTRVTVLAYRKFEAVSLQRRVVLQTVRPVENSTSEEMSTSRASGKNSLWIRHCSEMYYKALSIKEIWPVACYRMFPPVRRSHARCQ